MKFLEDINLTYSLRNETKGVSERGWINQKGMSNPNITIIVVEITTAAIPPPIYFNMSNNKFTNTIPHAYSTIQKDG